MNSVSNYFKSNYIPLITSPILFLFLRVSQSSPLLALEFRRQLRILNVGPVSILHFLPAQRRQLWLQISRCLGVGFLSWNLRSFMIAVEFLCLLELLAFGQNVVLCCWPSLMWILAERWIELMVRGLIIVNTHRLSDVLYQENRL